MINSKNLINISLIFVIILGVFLRLYNLNYDDLWFDEISSFWVSDPEISFQESLKRHKNIEKTPEIFCPEIEKSENNLDQQSLVHEEVKNVIEFYWGRFWDRLTTRQCLV